MRRHAYRALSALPYGARTSYGALAREVRRPGAARAVGAANGCNPVPILLPCHRVIGADGSLTGYGGGLWRQALAHRARTPCQGTWFDVKSGRRAEV